MMTARPYRSEFGRPEPKMAGNLMLPPNKQSFIPLMQITGYHKSSAEVMLNTPLQTLWLYLLTLSQDIFYVVY